MFYDRKLLAGNENQANLVVEPDGFNVVKHIQQVGLYGVGVRRLPQDLQESRIWDEEESRKTQPFFLQVSERKKKMNFYKTHKLIISGISSPRSGKKEKPHDNLIFLLNVFGLLWAFSK